MKLKLTFEWDFDKAQWLENQKFILESGYKFDGDPVSFFMFMNDICYPKITTKKLNEKEITL